jgi:Fe-S cluster assembly ATP-binding protein
MAQESVPFQCENVHVSIEGKEVVKGVSLTVKGGEIHALMGPNGSGKSTFANVLMGHPSYELTDGRICIKGTDVTDMSADERSRLGMFLAFQYPMAIPGVTVANFLRAAVKAHTEDESEMKGFRKALLAQFERLEIDPSFATRYVNDGFSGGEKKRIEILQMLMLKPTIALLDETDSGLDIDALQVVSKGINHLAGPDVGILLVTHYQRILNYVKPDFVHVFMGGRIVRSGGPELAHELEEKGYEWIEKETTATAGAM